MCQEGETWDLGQSQFFDAHLFNGSQFYIGSSFLHLFSNLWIIFWPTQIGQCMKKRGLNMQKDKRLSGLDLAPVGASIIESCRSSAPSCITRAAVTAGSEGSGGCRGDVVQRKEVHAAAAHLNFTDLVFTSHSTTNSKWLVWFALPFLNQAARISDTLLSI